MRRLHIVTEVTSIIELDESKLAALNDMNLSPEPMAVLIEKRIAARETAVADLSTAIGTSGGTDLVVGIEALVDIEQQCERHPEVWFALNERKALVGCHRCKQERRGQ